MSSLVVLLFVTIAQLTTSRASPEARGIHGVLSNRPVESLCTIFEADDGRNFILSTTAGFQLGDRIYVEGTIPSGTAGVCNEVIYPFLNNTVTRPGFAGIGTLERQGGVVRLRTDDGRVYGLRNRFGFGVGVGARVYVRDWVAANQNPPFIDQNVIGVPVSGFGRFIGTSSSDRRVLGEDGVTYRLAGLSARFVEFGDHVYFEGIRGPVSGGARNVQSSTGRYAFHATGRVVLENSVKVVKSDQLLFDDTFRAPGLDALGVGEKAFVFGIAPEDYDYLEPRNGRTIRDSRTGLGYSSTGLLSGNTFVASDSTTVEVEFGGTLPPGQLAYIAGELDLSDPGAPLVHHNVVLHGIDTTGTLELGFECAPLLIGSGAYFVEDEEGIPLHHCVHVVGGISFDSAPCPFPAIVDDTLTDLGPCGGGEER
jgi:hypothetical protein